MVFRVTLGTDNPKYFALPVGKYKMHVNMGFRNYPRRESLSIAQIRYNNHEEN